jgi:hypothetical protein
MNRISKRALLIAAGIIFAIPVFSQTAKSTAKKVPPQSGTSLSAEQSKMLCKAWKLDTVLVFGVGNKPNSKEAGDGITLMDDGSLFLTMEGVASTGKWTYAGGRINTATQKPDNKISFRVISLADTRMVLEYQYPAPDLTRVKYIYSPKK